MWRDGDAASVTLDLGVDTVDFYDRYGNKEVVYGRDGKFTFICVCNGRYYGGGFNPIPEADPTDGMLDILLVSHVSRAQVPFIIGKYKDGRYRELSKIARYIRADSIRITCDRETPVNLDGELRTATTVEMTVAREKIRFFYPRGLTWQAKEKITV